MTSDDEEKWGQFGIQCCQGSLCPRVPQRLNYLLWIEDVIVASGLDADAVRGIDIG